MDEYILVSGASSGIGQQIAIDLSRTHKVILCGRDMVKLQCTAQNCLGNGHLIWQYDLSDTSGIENQLSEFIQNTGVKVAGFVHSAGYMKTVPLKMAHAELFSQSFNVNVIAAAIIIKVLAKKNINHNHLKSVVIVSSNISNFGAKAFSAYGASKAAADGLMRSLAVELAPRIRVNSVLPGGVRTAMTEHIYQDSDLIDRMEASYPLGLGTTRDISDAVIFLLSDQSRWITGQQITVDGGRTINISG